jgi:hypothetical protein
VVIAASPPITRWLNNQAEIPQVIGGDYPSGGLKNAVPDRFKLWENDLDKREGGNVPTWSFVQLRRANNWQ